MSTVFKCKKCSQTYVNEKRYRTHIENCNKYDNSRNIMQLDDLVQQSEKSYKEPSRESRHSSSIQYSEASRTERERERESARSSRASVTSTTSRHDHCKYDSQQPQENDERRRRQLIEEKEKIDKVQKERKILHIIEELKTKIEKLETEKLYIQNRYEERIKRIQQDNEHHTDNIRSSSEKILADFNNLRSEIETIHDRYKQEILKIKNEKENLRLQLQSIADVNEEKLNKKLGELNKLRDEFKEKEDRVAYLERTIQNWDRNYHSLKVEYNNLESKYKADYEISEKKLKLELNAKQQECDNKILSAELKFQTELLKEKEELEQKRKEIEHTIRIKDNEIEQIRYNQSLISENNNKLITEYESRIQKLDASHKLEFRKLSENFNIQKIAIEHECDKKIHEVRSVCADKIRVFEDQVHHLKDQLLNNIQSKDDESVKMKSLYKKIEEVDQLNRDYLVLIEKLNNDNNSYRNQIKCFSFDIENLNKQKKDNLEEIERHKEQNIYNEAKYKIDIDHLLKEMKNLEEKYQVEINDLRGMIVSKEMMLNKNINDQDTKIQENNILYNNTSKEYNNLLNEYNKIKRTNEELLHKLANKSAELDMVNQNYSEMSTKTDTLLVTVNKQQEEITKMTEKVKTAESTATMCKMALRTEIMLDRKKQVAQLNEKDKIIQAQQLKLKDSEKYIELYNEAKKEVSQQIQEMSIKDKKYYDAISSAETKYNQKLDETIKQMIVLKDENRMLNELNISIKDEYEIKLRNMKVSSARDLQERIDQLQEQLTITELHMNEKDKKYQNAELEYLKSVAEIRAKAEINRQKEEMLDKKLDELSRERATNPNVERSIIEGRNRALADLRKANERNKELEAEIKKLNEKITEMKDFYNRELEQYERVNRECRLKEVELRKE